MNIARLIFAIVAAFVAIFATDLLIHEFWLAPEYKASAALWRPESQMMSLFHLMLLAQFLCALMFVLIWAKGFSGRDIATGLVFGIMMALFQQIWAIAIYVVMPLPGSLAVKWFFSGIVQLAIVGMIVAAIYKPAARSL